MMVNGWLRHTVLAVTVGVVAACMANAEADRRTAAGGHRGTEATDSVVRWQVAGTLRSELLAMLAAAERGDAVTASEHAAGAATGVSAAERSDGGGGTRGGPRDRR